MHIELEYDQFRTARQVAAAVGIVCGAGVMSYFVFADPETLKASWNVGLIIAWTLAPPLWFFLEYWLLEHGKHVRRPPSEHKETFLSTIKDYADYASKIWAAVLAILIFMYELKTRH
jgi:hypothetical protein